MQNGWSRRPAACLGTSAKDGTLYRTGWLAAGALALTMVAIQPAAAQDEVEPGERPPGVPGSVPPEVAEEPIAFSIPPQALSTALVSFTDRAGLQIFFDSDLVAGLDSPGVQGELPIGPALSRLLAGTGLTYRFEGANFIRLLPATDSGTATDQTGTVAEIAVEPVVVTASGFGQTLLEAPASISVITREELENKKFTSLQDAVKNVPGVYIVGGNDGEGSGISIRGMESSQTLILVDGRRVRSSEANPRGGGGDLDSNWIPPIEAIERVEVVRGPMSSLYGADAVGGVINVITRKVGTDWTGSLGLSYLAQANRKVGDQSQGDIYLAGPIFDELLGVQLWAFNEIRQEDETIEGKMKSNQSNVTGRLWFTPFDGQDFMFEYGRAWQDYERSADKSGDGSDDRRDYDRNSWAFAYDGDWGWGVSEFDFYQEKVERTTPLASTQVPTEAKNSVLDVRFTGFFLEDHIPTLGYQWMKTSSSKSDFRDLDDPNSTYGTRSVYQNAYYVEDEWTVLDDLALTAGVRLTDHEIYGTNWSPRGYFVWQPLASWTLKGGIGTGYKAPEIREIDPGVGSPQARGAILAYGNPDLEPETSTNFELGLYYSNLDDFGISATFYNNKFKNKIINSASYAFYYPDGTRVPGSGGCTPSDPPTTDCPAWGTWLNLPGATVRGVEVEANWQIFDSLNLAAAYTYADSSIKGGDINVTAPNGDQIPFLPGGERLDGQPLAGVPKHNANMVLTWTPTDEFSAYVRGAYEGKVTSVSFGRGNSVSYQPKAQTTFDIGASYQINSYANLSAVMYNVTNETRFDPDRVGEDGYYQYPEDGRRVWVQIRASF